jgi:molybdate transport system substrate-binding protein
MRHVFLFLLSSALAFPGIARDLRVAAAADLTYCISDINTAFKKANLGINLLVNTASSGNLAARIQNGEAFEVFLSADLVYPRKLAEAGLAERKSLFPYARGQLALWAIDPTLNVTKGLSLLTDPAIAKVSIANPAAAPYGRAARAALEKEAIWNAVRPKLVMRDDIFQAAQLVQAGSADAGIVALSLLKAPALKDVGKYWLIPPGNYPPLEQAAVLTSKGKDNPDAQRYVAFLQSPEAQGIFEKCGYLPPLK